MKYRKPIPRCQAFLYSRIEKVDPTVRAGLWMAYLQGGELSLRRFGKLKCGQKKVLPVYWADMVKDLGRCGQGAQHGNSLVKAFNACVVAGE